MVPVALCFPGQGSQAAGMAQGLVDLPLAQELLAEANRHGCDLGAALRGNAATLTPTAMAQPALLFVEAVLAAELPAGIEVVGVAGHSVGEYAAAVAAHAIGPREAMRLVVERGSVMAGMREGIMTALLGVDEGLAAEVCAEASTGEGHVAVVANVNAPGQVVISGTAVAVSTAAELALERGARRAVRLDVSGGFHSPLMTRAGERFAGLLDAEPFADPSVPVVCNVDGAAVTDAGGLRDRLRRQLTSPVRWIDCVRHLVSLGAEALVEVGPGTVLAGLAKRIVPEVPVHSVSTLTAAHGLSAVLGAGSR